MSWRISGSGGSSELFAGCITLMTEPVFVGVSVTRYDGFELEPTESSVAVPMCETRTGDRFSWRQLAISAGARCDDTYTMGMDASRAGPLEEPQAVRQAVTATTGASRRSLFMGPIVSVPDYAGN